MPGPVIIAENIGKRYRLSHQASAAGYQRFSEAVVNSAKGLWKRRAQPSTEEFWALKDVSFEINRGDVVGIIGRNGAGKSTLLKILSRITEPTTGRITLEGRVASLLEVGTGFHPELTGRENIFLNGAILGMARAEIRAKFDEIVAFAEIEKFLDTPVKRYSSGMYVRLAFAVAAHLEPEILIVDEVLAVGDAQFQQKCLGKMQDVASNQGRTVLFVSHQLGMIRTLCTKGILMAGGKALFAGSTEQAVEQYLYSASKGAQALASQFLAEVTGPSGEARPCIEFGGDLVLHIVLKQVPAGNAGLNVSIRNESGRQVCLFSTNPHDGFPLPSSPCRMRFLMPDCRLAPGDYSVDVAVTDPGFSIFETVSSAIQFSVSPRLMGGTWPYEAKYGDFFPHHEWAVQQSPTAE